MKKITSLTLILLATVAHADNKCQHDTILPNHQPNQFEIINNGSEIHDKATGLIWQRCSLGQAWSGNTCTGSAMRYTWQQAMIASQELGEGYRLPNIKELSSIANYQCHEPAFDPTLFPATPEHSYWSSSPYIKSPAYAWGLNTYIGDINHFPKSSTHHVRAVRIK